MAAELPTLSELISATFDHLPESSAYYRRAAGWSERAFNAARDAAKHPGGTEWEGRPLTPTCPRANATW